MIVTDDRKELFKALAAAQGEFTTVEKNSVNPHFKSKFAPLDSIIEMIRPILPKHGLSVMQHCDIPESGKGIIIETVIAHESGQYVSSRLFMPVSKEDPQGYGSSVTYGRRYSLGAALGIVSDEDVDGNQSEQGAQQRQQRQPRQQQQTPPQQQQQNQQQITKEPATQEQIAKIHDLMSALMDRDGGTEAAILKTISHFVQNDKEYFLTPETLAKNCSKGWAGKIIGKAEGMLKPPQ